MCSGHTKTTQLNLALLEKVSIDMFHPVCEHSPVWIHFCPICRRDKMFKDGPSHLATFCPICRQDKCSQVGCPICRRDLQIGQNVRRWDFLSADGPVCRRDKMFADGPSHLLAVPSADGTRCHVGRNRYKATCTQVTWYWHKMAIRHPV